MTDIPDRSAPKRGHRLAIALAAVAGALALAVVAFVASFDANRYKPELVQAVRERTGRALSIDGDLSLTVLPRLGLSMGPARLSGPGGRGEFAQFDSAQVGVALWPLLSRRIVVERVRLEGWFEGVRRRGSTNLDDHVPRRKPRRRRGAGAAACRAPPRRPPRWPACAARHDRLARRAPAPSGACSRPTSEAGRIAGGTPGSLRLSGRLIGKRPLVDVAIDQLSTGYTVDFATLATRLADLDLKARGRCPARWTPVARSLQVDRARDVDWPTRASRHVRATASRRRSKPPALAIAEGGARRPADPRPGARRPRTHPRGST